ncbi:fimbrial protein [Lelliottia sp. CFBP8978]|uniref:fimbrial protein n=1 Tax=Lelliottia sp. CFBP8978 TaxID=3096522 RepID=UPI002A6B1C19|nr:fimbrial protein [Lelliottia sp. CFBP8978]MDY1038702.1 fimbrial protein [Lelliottia sp. CFBP8978]
MKLITIMACTGALIGCLAGGAWASGTVQITGTITGKSCTVSPESSDFTVEMGNVSSKDFARAGDGTRYEPFVINLEKCGGSASGVTVSFQGNQNSLNRDLLALDGGTGYAAGMGVGIYNADKSLIPLGEESGLAKLTPNQMAVKINFYARYIADGAKVSPGNANASATFMLTYA